ncbi:ribose-phosphate diphosphokinase [Myxococcota bacterium]|nr:ribose-phosphate diphosphokinase [Myxococcota bacterium]
MTTLVFSTAAYARLADDLCALTGFEPAVLERRFFPDGERYLRMHSSPLGRDVALVGGTISESDTLELFDLACSVVKHGARSLTMVVPYFGYSTMERAVLPGEVVTAKNRARLLSAIPEASNGNRILMLDLHSEGLPHYFEGPVRPSHVYAKPVIADIARRLGGDDFVLGCTDAGRAKWVESLANDLGVLPSFVFKRRLDGERTEVTAVSAQVRGRKVVIYDDMIRTGGSLMGAARAFRDAGATEIAAIATHGLFPGDAFARVKGSGLFSDIVVTDSHPRARALEGEGLVVETVAPLLAMRMHQPEAG